MSARQSRLELTVRALVEQVQAIGWTSERIGHVFADAQGLHPTDFRALSAIYRAELAGSPLSAKALAQELDVQPSTVTYAVDRLVASGHARRERDPGDARRTLLRYGQEGPDVARRFFGPLGLAHAQAMAGFTDNELDAARRVLEAVVTVLESFEEELRRARARP